MYDSSGVFFFCFAGLVGALKGDSSVVGVGDDDGDDILAGWVLLHCQAK
jgi:hypothetical protein